MLVKFIFMSNIILFFLEKNAQATEKSADKAAKIDRRRPTFPETSSVTESADQTSLPRASDQLVPSGEKLPLMRTIDSESVNPLRPLMLSSSNGQANDAVIAREKFATDTSIVFGTPQERNTHSLKKSEALTENPKVSSNIHKETCATLNVRDKEHCINVQGSGKRTLSSSCSSSAQDKSEDRRRKNMEDSKEKDFHDRTRPKSSGGGDSHHAARVVSKFEPLSNSLRKDNKRKHIDDRILGGSKWSGSVLLMPESSKSELLIEKSSESTECERSSKSTKGEKYSESTNSMSADSSKSRVKMASQSSTRLGSKSSSTSTSVVNHLSLESKLDDPVPKLNHTKTSTRNDRSETKRSLETDRGVKKCKSSSVQSGKSRLRLPERMADEGIGVCQVSSSTESVIRSSKANSGNNANNAKLKEGHHTLHCDFKGNHTSNVSALKNCATDFDNLDTWII